MFQYDRSQMERAITNLISNALRYAASTVTLSYHQSDAEIRIAVIDDGAGIADEELPHVLDRFYKGRNGNHGLGLSIVKSIVELYHGEIQVSCQGCTCFEIQFLK